MTDILFIAAMPEEARAVRDAFGDRYPIVLSGMGNVPTMVRVEQAARKYSPELIVQVGIAGAVDKSLKVGDVVVVREDSNTDLGAFRPESNSFEAFEQELYTSDFSAEGFKSVTARTVTCACTPFQSHGKEIETMEGAGFMAAAQSLGIPFAQIRSISNFTDDDSGDWQEAAGFRALTEALKVIFGDYQKRDNLEILKEKLLYIDNFPIEGVRFVDALPLQSDPESRKMLEGELYSRISHIQGECLILAPEARGFILAPQLADRLSAPFIPLRKAGKLPPSDSLQSISYTNEYASGVFEYDLHALDTTRRTLIVYDDILATGGTALSCKDAMPYADIVYLFIAEIESLGGRKRLLDNGIKDKNIISLFKI